MDATGEDLAWVSIKVEATDTQAFHLPTIVPTTAKEVLLFVDVVVTLHTKSVPQPHQNLHPMQLCSLYQVRLCTHVSHNTVFVNSDIMWLRVSLQLGPSKCTYLPDIINKI